jgi:peroxiredoxin
MPLAPFAPRPVARDVDARVARGAVLAALLGIGAVLLAYVLAPGVCHAVRHAAGGVRHAVEGAVDRMFPEHGRVAPRLPAEVVVGPATSVRALHGHVAVISFWSQDCTPCARQASALRALAAQPALRGRVVAIADGGDLSGAQRFAHRHRWTFSPLLDGTGRVARRYGTPATRELPMTYVLDRNGRIDLTLRGPQASARLDAAVRRADRHPA